MKTITAPPWALILAGGDGTRLRALTRRIAGDPRPKQFCPLLDGETLLDRTRRRVDLFTRPDRQVVIVTRPHEPYFRSLETTGRLAPLARELDIPHVWAVANKVRTPSDEAAIREYCQRHGIELLAVVPFDPRVTEADNAGVAVLDHAEVGVAGRHVRVARVQDQRHAAGPELAARAGHLRFRRARPSAPRAAAEQRGRACRRRARRGRATRRLRVSAPR